jgi:hypothetical protein
MPDRRRAAHYPPGGPARPALAALAAALPALAVARSPWPPAAARSRTAAGWSPGRAPGSPPR